MMVNVVEAPSTEHLLLLVFLPFDADCEVLPKTFLHE